MSVVTLSQASTIVDAALKKGRDTNCAPLTVAVLDGGGHLVAFKREDKSGLLRFDIAFGKAWGALGMGFGSRTLAVRAAKTPQFFTMLAAASGGRMVTNPGGVLIRNGAGDIIGAVGISGDTRTATRPVRSPASRPRGSRPIPGRTRAEDMSRPLKLALHRIRDTGRRRVSAVSVDAAPQNFVACGHLPRQARPMRAPTPRGYCPLA